MKLDELIAKIKSSDPKVRTAAWQSAGTVGAPAVKPLAALVTDKDIEIGRAAKRAMWQIVRTVGRPGAEKQKGPVLTGLIGLLGDARPIPVRREAIWMISELSDGGPAVAPLAKLLKNKELREDARCALQRIPGAKPTEALKAAMADAPQDFKYALAEALRDRGAEVAGYASRKLVPAKQTKVKPVGR